MSHTRQILFAIACWACSLATGELSAQAPASRGSNQPYMQAQRGQKVLNSNARGAVSRGNTSPVTDANVPNSEAAGLTCIAVFGAVNQPTVIETTERSLSLGQLIERAGGLSPDNYGAVSLLDLNRSHSIDSIARNVNQQIGNGQIVYIVPKAGSTPTQLLGSRPVSSSKKILITGLTNGPRLMRIDDQRHTLGDLIFTLGQSVELLERGDVIANLPQGVPLTLDSELVANSVVHFNPAAVNFDGVREASLRGFRLEQPVRFDKQTSVVSPVTPQNAVQPVNPATINNRQQVTPKPQQPTREGPLPPETSSLIPDVLAPANVSSGIEAAGSSTISREPLPLPKESDSDLDSQPTVPGTRADGRPPLMMPKSWQQTDEASSEDSGSSSDRVIERTSAGRAKTGHKVVTASASVSTDEEKPRKNKPARGLDLSEIEQEGLGDAESETTSLLPGPQSWIILVFVAGLVGASVVVSRMISRPDFTARAAQTSSGTFPVQPAASKTPRDVQPTKPIIPVRDITSQPVSTKTSNSVASVVATTQRVVHVSNSTPAPKAADSEETSAEEDHRFLQRLILNKVTVVEEEPAPPEVDHLHGPSVGASRLIVHEAHESIAGPHFQVRPKGDAREIELRLRRLLRTDRQMPREHIVHTADVRESRVQHGGPLERALRSVERGGTP